MDHIHQYQRRKLGKSIIYKCILPGCSHFIQKGLAEGRLCICNRCERPFTITKKTLKYCGAKPHCEGCYKENPKDKKLNEILEKLIVD